MMLTQSCSACCGFEAVLLSIILFGITLISNVSMFCDTTSTVPMVFASTCLRLRRNCVHWGWGQSVFGSLIVMEICKQEQWVSEYILQYSRIYDKNNLKPKKLLLMIFFYRTFFFDTVYLFFFLIFALHKIEKFNIRC